jgi:hypothetical protein
MAVVKLGRYEVAEDLLPQFCIRCGAPAALVKKKQFAWHPSWIDALIIVGLIICTPAFLVGVILAFTMTTRLRVGVPLCADHQNHWSWRAAFIYGGFAVFFVLGAASFYFLMQNQGRGAQEVAGYFCAGSAICGLIWLIAAAIIQSTAIRATEITERSITLNHVAHAFKEALEAAREADAEAGRDRSRTYRRDEAPAEEFYDADRPRRPGPDTGIEPKP